MLKCFDFETRLWLQPCANFGGQSSIFSAFQTLLDCACFTTLFNSKQDCLSLPTTIPCAFHFFQTSPRNSYFLFPIPPRSFPSLLPLPQAPPTLTNSFRLVVGCYELVSIPNIDCVTGREPSLLLCLREEFFLRLQ